MTNDFLFQYYMDYEDGKMARVSALGEEEIPVNIFIDNAADHADRKPGPCRIDVSGVGRDVAVFASEEDYDAQQGEGIRFASVSMIPSGTFSPGGEDFQESPDILFTGIVEEAARNPDETSEANWCARVRSYQLTFDVYFHMDGDVRPGNVLQGAAWLFGEIVA